MTSDRTGDVTLAELVGRGGRLPRERALTVLGEIGFAVAASHDAGKMHGAIDADHVLIQPDGSARLLGAAGSTGTVAADLRALRRLAASSGDVAASDLADLDRAADAADLARTALALATSGPRPHHGPPDLRLPAANADLGRRTAANAEVDEGQRRVRNRLIGIAVLVVLLGFIALKAIGGHGGKVTVPAVTGIVYSSAASDLRDVGLVPVERALGPAASASADPLVIGQSPAAGRRVKPGSRVTLTVSWGAVAGRQSSRVGGANSPNVLGTVGLVTPAVAAEARHAG